MKPAAFGYLAPTSVAEAVEALTSHEGSVVLAGGQALVPLLARRAARPSALVDIGAIADLDAIRLEPHGVACGATATLRDLERSATVRREAPALAEAAALVGPVHVRNRGTLAGSVLHGDPAAQLPAALLACEATVHVVGPGGRRSCSIDDLLDQPYRPALAPGELVVGFDLPRRAGRTGGAFREFSTRTGDLPIVGVAATVVRDSDGRCTRVVVAACGVAGRAVLLDVTDLVVGAATIDAPVLREVAGSVARQVDPPDDHVAPAPYRRELLQVLCVDALSLAWLSAGRPDRPPATDERPARKPTRLREPASQGVVELVVNGAREAVHVEPRESLLDTLRDRIGLTGAHAGCGHGSCGACAVLVDGVGVRACLALTVALHGAEVTTVEGLSRDGLLPVQAALSRCHGLQCGFCTPGVVTAAVEMLADGGVPASRAELARELSGQLCRCTGYAGILDAVESAAGPR